MKALPGTHTFVPQSPPPGPGDPPTKSVLVTDGGNTLEYEGDAYAYNGSVTPDRYQARIPPPPADPPGEWRFITIHENDGEEFNIYEITDQGSTVWTEQGRDYHNG